jgi:hypothetical protein
MVKTLPTQFLRPIQRTRLPRLWAPQNYVDRSLCLCLMLVLGLEAISKNDRNVFFGFNIFSLLKILLRSYVVQVKTNSFWL